MDGAHYSISPLTLTHPYAVYPACLYINALIIHVGCKKKKKLNICNPAVRVRIRRHLLLRLLSAVDELSPVRDVMYLQQCGGLRP